MKRAGLWEYLPLVRHQSGPAENFPEQDAVSLPLRVRVSPSHVVCPEIYDILRDANASLCLWELKGQRSPLEFRSDLVYVRLHGPQTRAYRGSYPDKVLGEWKRNVVRWKRSRKQVLFYFDNDEKGYAPINAERLSELVSIS